MVTATKDFRAPVVTASVVVPEERKPIKINTEVRFDYARLQTTLDVTATYRPSENLVRTARRTVTVDTDQFTQGEFAVLGRLLARFAVEQLGGKLD